MLLKTDVYLKYIVGTEVLEIFQLLPNRKKWIIRNTRENLQDISNFFRELESGKHKSRSIDFTIYGKSEYVLKAFWDFLVENHLISDFEFSKSNTALKPFIRQLEYFDSWNKSTHDNANYQELILNSEIAIIGAGGVGTALATTLNSCGVEKIYICDDDIVSESNLGRQFQYGMEDLTQKKVNVLAKKLNNRGLGIVIPIDIRINRDNINKIIETYLSNVSLITGLPIPLSKSTRQLYERILLTGRKILCVGEHDVGPLLSSVSDIDLFFENYYTMYYLSNEHLDKRTNISTQDFHPSYLPEISIVTSIAADEIIRYITGYAKLRTDNYCFSLLPINYSIRLKDWRIKNDNVETWENK
ncbi:TPA: ThiF family adenylyltransferase [Streptococcus suis]